MCCEVFLVHERSKFPVFTCVHTALRMEAPLLRKACCNARRDTQHFGKWQGLIVTDSDVECWAVSSSPPQVALCQHQISADLIFAPSDWVLRWRHCPKGAGEFLQRARFLERSWKMVSECCIETCAIHNQNTSKAGCPGTDFSQKWSGLPLATKQDQQSLGKSIKTRARGT